MLAMLPAGHSDSDATLGSAPATASTRMACKGRAPPRPAPLERRRRVEATTMEAAGARAQLTSYYSIYRGRAPARSCTNLKVARRVAVAGGRRRIGCDATVRGELRHRRRRAQHDAVGRAQAEAARGDAERVASRVVLVYMVPYPAPYSCTHVTRPRVANKNKAKKTTCTFHTCFSPDAPPRVGVRRRFRVVLRREQGVRRATRGWRRERREQLRRGGTAG